MTDLELLHLITAPTRYQLLTLLLEYHYCVKALAAKLGISEPAVSQQLQVLKDCGLVTGERLDYQMHYRVDRTRLEQAVRAVAPLLRPARCRRAAWKTVPANLPGPAAGERQGKRHEHFQ